MRVEVCGRAPLVASFGVSARSATECEVRQPQGGSGLLADRRCRDDDGPSGTDVGADRPKHKRTYRREQWHVLVDGVPMRAQLREQRTMRMGHASKRRPSVDTVLEYE